MCHRKKRDNVFRAHTVRGTLSAWHWIRKSSTEYETTHQRKGYASFSRDVWVLPGTYSWVCKDRSPSNKFNPQEHRVQLDWRLSGGVRRIKIPLNPSTHTRRGDVHQPFIVTTDASGTHVGGVLNQVQAGGTNRAIGYFSGKLKVAECRYWIIDKEALAVELTCRHFHNFLWGTVFTIIKDH